MIDKELRKRIIALIHEEVVPAIGCTEPMCNQTTILSQFFNRVNDSAYVYNGMWKMIGATKVFEDGQEDYDQHYYHSNGTSTDPDTLIKTPTGNAFSDGWYKHDVDHGL